MTSIRLLLAVGGLCLAGAVPTMAQTTQPAASPGTIAAPAATYDSYIATARTTLHGWRVELDAFDAKAHFGQHYLRSRDLKIRIDWGPKARKLRCLCPS